MLESLAIIMEANGMETLQAENGAEGLHILKAGEHTIDLILCDINLPDMTGYDILAAVKNDHLLHDIPFIFLTAYADEKDVRTGMNMGADDYLTKPFSAKILVESINSRIAVHGRHKQHDRLELNKKFQRIMNANFKQEFYTPINFMLNASLLLGNKDEPLDIEFFQETIRGMYSSSFRMFRNSRNLILYSLIKSNELDNTESHFHCRSVTAVLNDTIQWYDKGLTKNKLAISLPEVEIPLVGVDNELLSVIFTELIDNAIKYNDSTTQPPNIHLTATATGFTLCVSNFTSKNVDFSLEDVIPYFKFHKDDSYVGLGLGLYISKRIASILNYTLSLTKSDGCVTFILSS